MRLANSSNLPLQRDATPASRLRAPEPTRGKSGGVRVIYYYHDERIPLYLLTLFGKNERANLSKAERNELAKLVDVLVTAALENHHGQGI